MGFLTTASLLHSAKALSLVGRRLACIFHGDAFENVSHFSQRGVQFFVRLISLTTCYREPPLSLCRYNVTTPRCPLLSLKYRDRLRRTVTNADNVA